MMKPGVVVLHLAKGSELRVEYKNLIGTIGSIVIGEGFDVDYGLSIVEEVSRESEKSGKIVGIASRLRRPPINRSCLVGTSTVGVTMYTPFKYGLAAIVQSAADMELYLWEATLAFTYDNEWREKLSEYIDLTPFDTIKKGSRRNILLPIKIRKPSDSWMPYKGAIEVVKSLSRPTYSSTPL